MPSRPTASPQLSEMTSVDILNGVREDAGANYADIVPQAVKPGDTLPDGTTATIDDSLRSLRGIGEILRTYQPLQNQFLTNIVNRIAFVVIKSRLYENPWNRFKKGFMEYGETIEELFVEMANVHQFDPDWEEGTPFKQEKPSVLARFHAMNYQKFYKTTVNDNMLRQAFLSWEGITDLISKIISQLYTAANYDEFLVMKYLIARLALDGEIGSVTIPAITAANARSVTTTMVAAARNLQFMNNQFNSAGVTTYTDPSKLWTIITTDASSVFDVEVLALSFNMSKAELIGRQIAVDSFATWDTARLEKIFKDDPYTIYRPFTDVEVNKLKSIAALMVDESWFMIYDNFIKMTEAYNPEKLYYNYWLHCWKTFSASPFANAILFTTESTAITGVTVTSPVTSTTPGAQVGLTATVSGTGFVNNNVSWSVSGNLSKGTAISTDGILTVGKDETASSLSVTATSVVDVSKKASTSITVA